MRVIFLLSAICFSEKERDREKAKKNKEKKEREKKKERLTNRDETEKET